MVAHNTNYYRRNKEKRFKIHKCPHCNFETTGPKSSLQAHIWAKHTDEKDRPFQCPCDSCHRGYSARANLHKHLKQCHDLIIPKDKDVFAYAVNINNNICPRVTNNQKKRLEFSVAVTKRARLLTGFKISAACGPSIDYRILLF